MSSIFTTHGCKGRYREIQRFTAASSRLYRIKAWGARAGEKHTPATMDCKPGTFYGGKGALKEGIFSQTKGTVFNIVVGQRGGNSVEVKGGQSTQKTTAELGLSVEDNAGTRGWGVSFVYTTSNILYLVAGGGGVHLIDIIGSMVTWL